MRGTGVFTCVLAFLAGVAAAKAADCPGNPDAIGTSRVIAVDPSEHARVGTMQYRETLPLEDHEVVLTFDDGPLPPYTNRILDILASQCVKATYFIVGRMAHAYPDTLRRIYSEGHTIGTHSQNHPLSLNRLPTARAEQEIDDGIASVTSVLGDPREVAPFFRVPGLARTPAIEQYLAAKGIMTWSADFPADDWKRIGPAEIMKRALTRLEAKGKGVLLLHDIHPATALALPGLLHELKVRGYRIVQVVPASPEHPKTETTAAQWLMHPGKAQEPPVASLDVDPAPPELPAPSMRDFSAPELGAIHPFGPRHVARRGRVPLPPAPLWPPVQNASLDAAAVLPVPGPESFGYSDALQPVIPVFVTHAAGHFSMLSTRPANAPRAAALTRTADGAAQPRAKRAPSSIEDILEMTR